MARAPQTPRQQWSDGIHFVRAASVKDRHPMRFVIGSRTSTRSKFSRHVPTLDEGIARGREATLHWLKANPRDSEHWTEQPSTPQAASGEVENSATPTPILEPFSITHFDCVAANPVAQVWQCTSRVGEKKSSGRPRKDGSAAQAAVVTHDLGQCAILIHKEPVRDEAGKVTVYPNWSEAADAALVLFYRADEEDRLTWSVGDKRVSATPHIDVIFDPDINGSNMPFSLYLPEYRRPVYVDRTRPNMPGRAPKLGDLSGGDAVNAKEQRKRHLALSRVPSFEERPLRFRTIYGAIEEAERREKMLRGESV